ncbi:hypothetical protein COT48_01430 [Candidatus Woesearchaeota archaeon CG08_land_8_20_14_0_20_47_9]|nr:MAG: hypothetical protein COV22_01050 [Candidatus Woesearchaeota archaeon CG10_big_fil_rev_8_21_14_0_10_47_5]PIO04253.1 MAG: hypothetical protein COT48_01430 [Candidatus Woesearchaeota archaeon CG08_land_8_20_14_0_20_47_9]
MSRIEPTIKNKAYALRRLKQLLYDAVRIRLPDQKFGLLFSGGIDSIVIARALKDSGREFTCFTAATDEGCADIVNSRRAAQVLGLRLRYWIMPQDEVESYLKKIIPLIRDSNPISVGVALPIYTASELASRDGCKAVFSGTGADELFAGYNRHKHVADLRGLNRECYYDVLNCYKRDLYRDGVITRDNGLELIAPYLDSAVVDFALRIDPGLKIFKGDPALDAHSDSRDRIINKYILRELALKLNIPKSIAFTKKKAAQYGSGFDRAIERLAKKHGYKYKSTYLEGILTPAVRQAQKSFGFLVAEWNPRVY